MEIIAIDICDSNNVCGRRKHFAECALRMSVIWQSRGPCNAHYMTLFSYILNIFYTSSIVFLIFQRFQFLLNNLSRLYTHQLINYFATLKK